jgi:hypothetical protein
MGKKHKHESDSPLTKKERKALKAREQQIAAELAERKASKKTDDPKLEAAVGDGDELDTAIKERVGAKREARAALEALDRSDDDAVKAFNETHGKNLGHYATSTRESEEQSAKMDRTEQRVAAISEPITIRITAGDESLAGPTYDKLAESVAKKLDAAVFKSQQVEEVETDKGRVFVTSEMSDQEAADVRQHNDELSAASSQPEPAEARGFALPSEGKSDFETNGIGQYKVKRPSDGKLVGYTRVTTFIDAIDDKSTLTDWKMRILLEGIVANEDQVIAGDGDLHLSTVRDLVHRRDVDLAKARKKDRKGKLEVGELAGIEEQTLREYRNGMKQVVEALLELGGVHEKANKGTDLNRLGQLYFETGGLDAVGAELTAGTITPSDMADIEALDRAVVASGFKWERSEVMVVNDEAKIAGRLDGTGMIRLPGSKRATRVVFDIKTGRIDMGTKIPMQLANYAGMKGYDPETPDEREDLKINATKALLIHLPAGKGECHMYVVDLPTGRVGNRLATEVRHFRSAGKKGIDTSVDLATGIALEAPQEDL